MRRIRSRDIRFAVREVAFKKRGKSYVTHMASGTDPNGKRLRKCLVDREAAALWAKSKELEYKGQCTFKPVLTRLTQDQVTDAETAFGLFGDQRIVDAVHFFLRHYRPVNKEVLMRDAVEEFIWDRVEHLRPRSVKQLRSSLRLFKGAV